MPRTGKCLNPTSCLLAYRNELITLPDDAPFECPECKHPLIESGQIPGRHARLIPAIILGGISLLVISGAIAVYIQVLRLKDQPASGQIGTSFEQAQVAAEHGEFLPSRHMPSALATPDTSGTRPAGWQYMEQAPSPSATPGN